MFLYTCVRDPVVPGFMLLPELRFHLRTHGDSFVSLKNLVNAVHVEMFRKRFNEKIRNCFQRDSEVNGKFSKEGLYFSAFPVFNARTSSLLFSDIRFDRSLRSSLQYSTRWLPFPFFRAIVPRLFTILGTFRQTFLRRF